MTFDLPVAGVVSVGEVEGLRSVGWPVCLVVEWGGVPDNLVHELGNADWVSRRAGASQRKELGGARSWVCYVRLVVGRVKILAVPACGELDV